MDLLLGAVVGLTLARVHAWLVYRAAARIVDGRGGGPVLVGFLVRVVIPAAGLFALALLSPAALVIGALAFVVGQGLARVRLEPDPTDPP